MIEMFQPMPKIEQNAPDFEYTVTYQRIDIEDAPVQQATVQHPEAWHYAVPDRNLGIYKPFRITVKASNARGESTADVNSIIGYSGEDGNAIVSLSSRAGSGIVRIDPLRFLARCRTRRLNQALSVLSLSLGFF